MTTYNYDRLTSTQRRRVACPVCGRKRTVQRTFGQTVNPFHSAIRDRVPTPTYTEARSLVRANLTKEAESWQPSEREATHVACADGGGSDG